MANTLTTAHIQGAYRIASQVMDHGLSLKQGVAQLVTEGVGATYAQDLINVYRSMRLGRCYHRTINVEATDYFLRQLFEDGGGRIFRQLSTLPISTSIITKNTRS
ncbi:hypothetical protein M5G25_16115 [Pseudomonas sp. TNT2022 ID357]|uniref:Uncharacterized protein n=1 Tax=Pseudomonas idahonensis TaxID=2942628 RepID=A0ABT5Q731_9PSED|nr:hypothetical protein [Pseudomonas idahonensis]MDD1149815.1 hypothetical protein [Pseudomonas idahonensis]